VTKGVWIPACAGMTRSSKRSSFPHYFQVSKHGRERTSVIKTQLPYETPTFRGLRKVTVHCYLTLIAMQASYSASHVAVCSVLA